LLKPLTFRVALVQMTACFVIAINFMSFRTDERNLMKSVTSIIEISHIPRCSSSRWRDGFVIV